MPLYTVIAWAIGNRACRLNFDLIYELIRANLMTILYKSSSYVTTMYCNWKVIIYRFIEATQRIEEVSLSQVITLSLISQPNNLWRRTRDYLLNSASKRSY